MNQFVLAILLIIGALGALRAVVWFMDHHETATMLITLLLIVVSMFACAWAVAGKILG